MEVADAEFVGFIDAGSLSDPSRPAGREGRGSENAKKTPTTTGEEAVGFQEFVGSSGMSIRF